jgi:hypothetical protein
VHVGVPLPVTINLARRGCDVFQVLPYLNVWGTVLLEKLTVVQLAKKFTAIYGTQRFITMFKTACHWSLSWAATLSHHFF